MGQRTCLALRRHRNVLIRVCEVLSASHAVGERMARTDEHLAAE